MKTYKIPVLDLHDTKIPEDLVNIVKNGLAQHIDTSVFGYAEMGNVQDSTVSFAIFYKGHDEIPRKYKIEISVVS